MFESMGLPWATRPAWIRYGQRLIQLPGASPAVDDPLAPGSLIDTWNRSFHLPHIAMPTITGMAALSDSVRFLHRLSTTIELQLQVAASYCAHVCAAYEALDDSDPWLRLLEPISSTGERRSTFLWTSHEDLDASVELFGHIRREDPDRVAASRSALHRLTDLLNSPLSPGDNWRQRAGRAAAFLASALGFDRASARRWGRGHRDYYFLRPPPRLATPTCRASSRHLAHAAGSAPLDGSVTRTAPPSLAAA